MSKKTTTTLVAVNLSPEDLATLDRLADSFAHTRSGMLRYLIRQEAFITDADDVEDAAEDTEEEVTV